MGFPTPFPKLPLSRDGKWIGSETGAPVDVGKPADKNVLSSIAKVGIADLECAVAAVRRATKTVSARPASGRAHIFKNAAVLLRRRGKRMPMKIGKALADTLDADGRGTMAIAASFRARVIAAAGL